MDLKYSTMAQGLNVLKKIEKGNYNYVSQPNLHRRSKCIFIPNLAINTSYKSVCLNLSINIQNYSIHLSLAFLKLFTFSHKFSIYAYHIFYMLQKF